MIMSFVIIKGLLVASIFAVALTDILTVTVVNDETLHSGTFIMGPKNCVHNRETS